MVEGPAVGKAGNFLDWIAGGLEMNEFTVYPRVSRRLSARRSRRTESRRGRGLEGPRLLVPVQ